MVVDCHRSHLASMSPRLSTCPACSSTTAVHRLLNRRRHAPADHGSASEGYERRPRRSRSPPSCMTPSRSGMCLRSVPRPATSWSNPPTPHCCWRLPARASRPCLPIVEHIARPQPRRTVIVAHADRTAQDHALREIVLHVGRQLDDFRAYSWYETVDPNDPRSRQGFMDLSEIPLPGDVQVFTCGPLPFMRHIRSTLLKRGVPASRIRYEVFGPDLWAAQTPAEPAQA
jgi:hypothetical protein